MSEDELQYVREFEHEWLSYEGVTLPTNHLERVVEWRRAGVAPESVMTAIGIGMYKDGVYGGENGRFNYVAGVIRQQAVQPSSRQRASATETDFVNTTIAFYEAGVAKGRTDLYEAVQDLLSVVRDLTDPQR